MLLYDIPYRLYKGSGHATNGMFQHQPVHVERYDGQCQIGINGLSAGYR